MNLDPQKMSPSAVYHTMVSAIVPRPIAWVSTVSKDGIANLAPFSFFSGATASPPSVMFSPVNRPDGSSKDTVANIKANGQFVINVVPFELAKQMNLTSAEFPIEVSEFEAAGLTPIASEKVSPPGVKESPIQIECELIQIVEVGQGPLAANLVIGKILFLTVADYVTTNGRIDASKLDAIGRLGGKSYCRTVDQFELDRPKA
jgi:flavin reductase (DIM6/NTAB) family NADH-FMN oxidoreductase RutF